MSWVYRLVGDALADLKELDVWLQEEVLDELEALCLALPSAKPSEREILHDFERPRQGQRKVVFVRLRCDDKNGRLTVLGIVAVSTPLSK